MAIITHRSILRHSGPGWLRQGTNLSIMFGIGLIIDLIADMLVAAVRRRFTSDPIPDALGYIGQERGISRGPSEDAISYRVRLDNWLPAVRRKGHPLELLQQVRDYFAAWGTFQIDLVYATGLRFIMDPAGAVTRDTVTWTPFLAGRCRWYIFLRSADDLPVTDYTLRSLLASWNAQHALGHAYVLHSGTHLWGEPGLTWGEPGLTWVDTAPRELLEIRT